MFTACYDKSQSVNLLVKGNGTIYPISRFHFEAKQGGAISVGGILGGTNKQWPITRFRGHPPIQPYAVIH